MLIALDAKRKDIPRTAKRVNRRENGQNSKSVQSAMAQASLSRTMSVKSVTVTEFSNMESALGVMDRENITAEGAQARDPFPPDRDLERVTDAMDPDIRAIAINAMVAVTMSCTVESARDLEYIHIQRSVTNVVATARYRFEGAVEGAKERALAKLSARNVRDENKSANRAQIVKETK